MAICSKPAIRTPTILCIDDDPEVVRVIELHFREFDARVVHACYGMRGLTEARRQKPEAIVMDVRMPGGDGATILEHIRRQAETANTPVIILSGMRDRALKERLFRLGANSFLAKPIHCDELVRVIGHFVKLRKLTTQELDLVEDDNHENSACRR